MKVEKQIQGNLLCQYKDGFLIQIRDCIWFYSKEFHQGAKICRVGMPFWQRLFIYSRLIQRLLRTDIRASAVFHNRLYFAYNGALYSCDLLERLGCVRHEMNFRHGMRSPLSICVIENEVSINDQICFGEYYSNSSRNDVCIYASEGEGEWNLEYVFPAGTIRHIHSIKHDKFRNCLYILTGDLDSESIIWKSTYGFDNVSEFISNGQQSRCSQMQIRKDSIIYVTDSEYEDNYLYKVLFDCDGNIAEIEKKESFKGSVIYGTSDDKNMYFSTTVEPDKGGINSNQACLWKVDSKYNIKLLFKGDKDIFPMKYFMYGFIKPVISDNKLAVTVTGLVDYDGYTILLEQE